MRNYLWVFQASDRCLRTRRPSQKLSPRKFYDMTRRAKFWLTDPKKIEPGGVLIIHDFSPFYDADKENSPHLMATDSVRRPEKIEEPPLASHQISNATCRRRCQ